MAQPSNGEPARAPGWLADPALSRIWEAARARLERSHLEPAGRIVLTGLERAERHAIGDLLARPVVTDRVTVDLAELDQVLACRSPYRSLAATVEALTGRPLRDRRAERSAAAGAREQPLMLARELLIATPALADIAWGETWLAAIRRSGLLTRADDPPQAVRHVMAVLAKVLARGAAMGSRTELAAQVCGDAHGLDDGTVVAQLALRALALDAGGEPPATAAERRDMWERYGVSADSVSSTCLTLGVLAQGAGLAARRLRLAARRLRLAAKAGDPVHITPRDLRCLEFARHRSVLVCENPRILEAAADRLGGAVPVVCAAGQPRLVTLDLLRRLVRAGAVLRYHGDFDWPGLTIANRLVAEVGAAPWLMAASNYLAAAGGGRTVLGLSGAPADASWDPTLRPVMSRVGVAVHEEAVLDEILAGLTAFAGP
jgi:uncharacterized protein (TIGR02679 family)